MLIRATHSGVDYKGVVAATGRGRILKRFPLNAGIDVAGVVESADDPRFAPGAAVLVNGTGLGESVDGGFAEYVRVSADTVVLPMTTAVRAASELLGIDPLVIANEGKALIGVRPAAAEAALRALRAHPQGRDAAIVGTCTAERPGQVVLDTGFGARLLIEVEGAPLPRIC